jgi:hypothetical protein
VRTSIPYKYIEEPKPLVMAIVQESDKESVITYIVDHINTNGYCRAGHAAESVFKHSDKVFQSDGHKAAFLKSVSARMSNGGKYIREPLDRDGNDDDILINNNHTLNESIKNTNSNIETTNNSIVTTNEKMTGINSTTRNIALVSAFISLLAFGVSLLEFNKPNAPVLPQEILQIQSQLQTQSNRLQNIQFSLSTLVDSIAAANSRPVSVRILRK